MNYAPSASADPSDWTMTRLYDDGAESHWGAASWKLDAKGAIGKMSRRIESTGVYLRYTSGSYDFSWHNAPQRQIIVCLNGSTSVTTGDGSERVFGAGDCVLAEDCGGRGHESKSADGAGRWSLFITLPDDERGDDERGDDAAVAPGPRRGDAAARAFALGAVVGALVGAAAMRAASRR